MSVCVHRLLPMLGVAGRLMDKILHQHTWRVEHPLSDTPALILSECARRTFLDKFIPLPNSDSRAAMPILKPGVKGGRSGERGKWCKVLSINRRMKRSRHFFVAPTIRAFVTSPVVAFVVAGIQPAGGGRCCVRSVTQASTQSFAQALGARCCQKDSRNIIRNFESPCSQNGSRNKAATDVCTASVCVHVFVRVYACILAHGWCCDSAGTYYTVCD